MEERKKREKLCGAAVERGVSFAGTDAVERVTDPARKDAVASEILVGLPEWFGLPESTKEYIEGCRSLPFWRCQSKGRTVGFLALKETSPYTAEIFVMGVCREFHRTMVSMPKILILDEATSSIDTHTELLVQKGIEALLAGRTSFVIAHRLSTIQNADRIFVIDQGGILEQGSPAELMGKKGAYYKLYMQQFADV